MEQDWNIECGEEEYVYRHIRVAQLLFRIFDICHCHQVAQVVFRADMAPVVEEVRLCLWVFSLSVNVLLRHFGREGSLAFDFHEPLWGVFLSQPLPIYAQEAHHPHRYGATHIWSHAASHTCCFWFYEQFLNVWLGSYFQWLQLQCRGGLTGVCAVATSHQVAHLLKRQSSSSIRIQNHLVDVFLQPWLAVVERWGRW